jgi:hypothetical protein
MALKMATGMYSNPILTFSGITHREKKAIGTKRGIKVTIAIPKMSPIISAFIPFLQSL